MAWEGYDIIPLPSEIDLWDEGQAMSSCLYKIRRFCNKSSEPSRFFSVRKNGLRCATLELVQGRPGKSGQGLGRMDGPWRLQDCRLSHNRLPTDELVKLLDAFGRHYDTWSRQPAAAAPAAEPAPSIGSSVPAAPTPKGRQHWQAGNTPGHPCAPP